MKTVSVELLTETKILLQLTKEIRYLTNNRLGKPNNFLNDDQLISLALENLKNTYLELINEKYGDRYKFIAEGTAPIAESEGPANRNEGARRPLK